MTELNYQISILMNQMKLIDSQLNEIKEALKELENVDSAYSLVSTFMVKKSKDTLKKELDQKIELLTLQRKKLDSMIARLKSKHNDS